MSSAGGNGNARLTGLGWAGALSLFQECIDALAVYQRSLATNDLKPRTKQQGAKSPRAAIEMAEQEVILDKLLRDCRWLEELLNSAKRSLSSEGHVDAMIAELSSKAAEHRDEDALLTKARELAGQLDRRKRELMEKRAERLDQKRRMDDELLRLRNEEERLKVTFRAESSYVKSWLDSRCEQQRLRADISREKLTAGLERCRLREEHEQLVAKQVTTFLLQSIEENKSAARGWSDRRLSETKCLESQIRGLREQITKRRAALDELRKEYEERQEFIDKCMAEREAARRQHELEVHISRCAVRIQAWWRGVMVRKKLGPYRPEEKKKKRPAKPKK